MRPTSQARVIVPLLAVALGAAACGSSDDSPSANPGSSAPSASASTSGDSTPKKGGVLNVLGEEDFTHFDTAPAYDTNTYHLLRVLDRQLYTNLSGDDATRLDVVPDLATAAPTVSADGKTYTVTLKDGVQWNTSPARQITAADVIRGVKFTCNPDNPFGSTSYFTDTIVGFDAFCAGFAKVKTMDAAATKAYVEGTDVAGLKATDDKTVSFTLVKPVGDFIHLLTLPTTSPRPVEAEAYVVDSPQYRQNKIESGPYQVASYVPDKSVKLTRNPAWKAETDKVRPANVDEIDFTFGGTAEGIQQQIEAGSADLAVGNTAPPAASIATLSQANDPNLTYNLTGGLNPYAVFNLVGGNPALKNKDVRIALNYLTNKRNLVQVAGGTKVAAPGSQIFPKSVVGEGWEKQDLYATPGSAGDVDKAKAMLAAAGFPNLTLKMTYRQSGNGPKYFATLQEDFKKGGVTLVDDSKPNKDFYSNYIQKSAITKSGSWDIALPGWSPDWEGSSERSFYSPLLNGRVYTDGSTNYNDYSNPAVDAAADKALATSDQASIAAQWNAIDKQIMEDAPWIPLVEQTQANYHSKRVDGFAYYFSASNGDLANFFIK